MTCSERTELAWLVRAYCSPIQVNSFEDHEAWTALIPLRIASSPRSNGIPQLCAHLERTAATGHALAHQ
jgi:hypothetical protein